MLPTVSKISIVKKEKKKKHVHVNPVGLLPNPRLLFLDSIYRNRVRFLVKVHVNELNTSDSGSIFTCLSTGFTSESEAVLYFKPI